LKTSITQNTKLSVFGEIKEKKLSVFKDNYFYGFSKSAFSFIAVYVFTQ